MKPNIHAVQTWLSHHTKRNDSIDADAELSFDLIDEANYQNGEFLNSLEQLTEADVPLSAAAVKKKKTPAELFRLFLFYASSVAFVVSCIMLVQNLTARQKGEEIYSQLASEFLLGDIEVNTTGSEGDAVRLDKDREVSSLSSVSDNIARLEAGDPVLVAEEKSAATEELQRIRAQLQALAAKNEDTYGWIVVEGTNINYPIVQGDDNEYYLDHAFTGDYLPIGSVYADYRCNTSINKNYNTVFYAHNITSGAMFHDVTEFFKDDVFENTKIVIYTFDGKFVYEPFAIYESRYDNNYFKTGFTSFDDFKAFTDKIKEDATKVKDVEFTSSDRIITMSTCTNGASTQRYALHARLVEYVVD